MEAMLRPRRMAFTLGKVMKTKKKVVLLTTVTILVTMTLAFINSHRAFDDSDLPLLVTETKVKDAFEEVFNRFKDDTGRFPTTAEGFEALARNPGIDGWKGPYLNDEDSLIDGWGREFVYESPGYHNTESYDLHSLGEDGVESQDDITNWN